MHDDCSWRTNQAGLPRRSTIEVSDLGGGSLSHHGVLFGRHLKDEYVTYAPLYIVRHSAYVHVRDACSVGRVRMFVSVGSRILPPKGGHRSLRFFRVNIYRRTPPSLGLGLGLELDFRVGVVAAVSLSRK